MARMEGVTLVDNVTLMNLAPRCRARAKHSGVRCKSPAVKGFNVCRMHGARGGNRMGTQNSNYRHGAYTRETKALLNEYRSLMKVCRETIEDL